ncbi:hypothetical protein [Falsiroseomonas ponticola]|uniref:hypothetical protein n=1 Tax=Falsiroseomonas ponticola TaxID=2786951 RepID=UPI0019320A92|nr:hypothetical protein [Roseomonas ponticola]
MARQEPVADDEARARLVKITGDRPEDVAAMLIEDVRALLAAVDAQLNDYVALGFMTPAEANAY